MWAYIHAHCLIEMYHLVQEEAYESVFFSIDQGVGVRAVSGEKTAFAYSDDISLEALQKAAVATKSIAASGNEQTAKRAWRYDVAQD